MIDLVKIKFIVCVFSVIFFSLFAIIVYYNNARGKDTKKLIEIYEFQ